MPYHIEFKSRALKDLKSIPKEMTTQILVKIREMESDLEGDIKRLTNHFPEYRLRVGNYRILFGLNDESILIYRIKHRREAYK
ncbi:MAG: type II toxin-antitoxin system RelE/ParE family toxin [SAR324 cluster bacterium]|nr:type II toxin-antitoxin system RelE/ParE family toxin [SAR324 cluster bacterium]MCH8887638.1 type II toxin-antitoxin system RelE/ParE family toxin [SAR324 cluster bacterium]